MSFLSRLFGRREPKGLALPDLSRLDLGPDDALVVRLSGSRSCAEIQRIREALERALDGKPALILDDGISLSVMRRPLPGPPNIVFDEDEIEEKDGAGLS